MGVTMSKPSREDAHTMDRRILQAVALADSPSYGKVPLYLWWEVSCPALISTSR